MQNHEAPDQNTNQENSPSKQEQHKQEQSDPQLTELRGFTKPSEDLEPTLADGTKSPEKAEQQHQQNKEQGNA